jgi:hypothetical protein
MPESALFKSYRESEKARARKLLDEALARVESARAEPEPAPVTPVTPHAPQAAEPATATPEREPGVVASVKRGLGAIPRRFVEGGKEVADALYPGSPDDPRGVGMRALHFASGVLQQVFPFGAFANEVGADFAEWLHSGGALSDATLREGLERVRGLQAQTTKTTDPAHIEMLAKSAEHFEHLLTVPETARIEQVREKAGLAAEMLSGVIPGYTMPALPGKPPKPVVR